MGSSRGMLVGQFLIETMVLTLFALILSLLLVLPALWLFVDIVPKGLQIRIRDAGNWLFLQGGFADPVVNRDYDSYFVHGVIWAGVVSASRRAKEIGIRKVMGEMVAGLSLLLTTATVGLETFRVAGVNPVAVLREA